MEKLTTEGECPCGTGDCGDRCLHERVLLPPGTTLSRAMSTGPCTKTPELQVEASGADPCASERRAADALAVAALEPAEVLRLKEELAARQGAPGSDQL
ncbi:hypothetical protein AK812_SmicGene44127 [Symbiodinium microadriaticum]|uniref:Uncharacterized protein n=1 Tax=Symbiodinium microadriaticum TaxID=2951 RepID=A0A1Q9BZ90_SYMMI|nr:hypothetical protein AK812_SmicGene44127 [Symbiodinium microadriaticum]